MNRLIMIGSGGHAKAIMSSLSDLYRENLIGYVDIKEDIYFSRKLKYLGNDEIVAEKYQNESVELIIGLSYLGSKVDINLRKKIIDFYLHKNFDFISIISIFQQTVRSIKQCENLPLSGMKQRIFSFFCNLPDLKSSSIIT